MSTQHTPRSPRPALPRRRLPGLMMAGSAAVASTTGTLAHADPGSRPYRLRNPRFEDGLHGWEVTGPPGAAEVDEDAPLLRCRSSGGVRVVVSQELQVRRPGWRTLRARVRADGAVPASSIVLVARGVDQQVVLPVTGEHGASVEIAVSARLPAGELRIELRTESEEEAWAEFTELSLEHAPTLREVRGVDLSGVPKNEECGAVYLTADGTTPVDPVQVFADHGATTGRLRVWVDPADGYCTPERTVAMARRIAAAGMDILIDFHYSDTWTDPGAQGTPAAWQADAPHGLPAAVADHTRATLVALREAGVDVAAVQVGNEINPGMLWPWGQTWDVDPDDGVEGARFDALARFLTAGSEAVTEVFPDAEVILHLTNIHDGVDGLSSWFDEITARAVPFDVIGLSYYSYWHGTFQDLQRAITVLADRFERDVIVVETAYAHTLEDDPRSPFENIIAEPSQLTRGYPATPEGQAANFRAVQDVAVAAPTTGTRCRGAIYWEPAWTAVDGAGWDPEDPSSGNAWENQSMFDHEGRLLPAPLSALG